uniref:Uncharacterized protein n=1 Tax=Salix viminalis TaxID=40686 RepID=A0A6N2K7G6_SALVM
MDADVTMVTAGEASSSSSRKPKRFEIKKWNAVALWAWGFSHGLVICILLLCTELGFMTACTELGFMAACTELGFWAACTELGFMPACAGGCAIMPSTSTVSADGSKPAKCALLIIASGSSRSMATKIDGASGTAGSTLSFRPALGRSGGRRECHLAHGLASSNKPTIDSMVLVFHRVEYYLLNSKEELFLTITRPTFS